MYDRFTNHHGLNNLIWVWTSDEAGDAMDWYPGDAYVDVIGRDYYYYPRIANHGSLVASFEKLKDIFGGTKLLTLSENGSIPHADSMVAEGAGWSYFMPWYGDYTMDGWAHDNTAADWKSILNHDYILTLDEMPGWANYTPPAVGIVAPGPGAGGKGEVAVRYAEGMLRVELQGLEAGTVELFTLGGSRAAILHAGRPLGAGAHAFALKGLEKGLYLVRVRSAAVAGAEPSIAVKSLLVTGM